MQEALRLSPRDTDAYVWMIFAGLAKLQLAADEEAVARLRRSVDINRNNPRVNFYLAAALAHLGHVAAAPPISEMNSRRFIPVPNAQILDNTGRNALNGRG